MPSILDRITNATRALFGREERSVPPPYLEASRFHGMPAHFKPEESLRAYGDNPWLYRAVLAIATEIGRTNFKLRMQRDDDELDLVKNSQALETLRKPQMTKKGKSMLTAMDLKIITGMHLLLNGESFWLLDRKLKINGAPTFIQPLLPQFMHSRIGEDGELEQYVYRLPDKEFRFDPLEIVHFRIPNPENIFRGHSPVKPIRYSIDTHIEADMMNFYRLRNNAVPGGVLETENNLDDDDYKRLKAQWTQLYGGPKNSNRAAVLPKGLKFSKVQESNQDMQFKEGKEMNRDEILASYGVGLEILGKTESQTRSNAEASIFVFQRFGVLPYLEKMADTLTNDYLPGPVRNLVSVGSNCVNSLLHSL